MSVATIPPGHVVLPCNCVVASKPGELARCPAGHDPDVPDHLRQAPKPRGRY